MVFNQEELLFAIWQERKHNANPTVRIHIKNLGINWEHRAAILRP
jgi:DNA-binding response OmpR family regulator